MQLVLQVMLSLFLVVMTGLLLWYLVVEVFGNGVVDAWLRHMARKGPRTPQERIQMRRFLRQKRHRRHDG